MSGVTKITLALAKVYIGLLGLILISMWALWFISPEMAQELCQVKADSITGINMLKSDMGGAVLIIGLFIFLYFFKGKKWLFPAIVSTAAILVTRTLSMIIDGASINVVSGIAMEALAVLAFYFILKADVPFHE